VGGLPVARRLRRWLNRWRPAPPSTWRDDAWISPGARCLVLGSAPDPRLPAGGTDDLTIICVNASGWSARRLGLPDPAVTVLGGFKLSKPERGDDRKALQGLRTTSLLLTTYRLDMSLRRAKQALRDLDFTYARMATIDNAGGARIVEGVTRRPLATGKRDERVSHGLFAVCLAFHLGASEVILSGFSLSTGRLNHTDMVRPRQHIPADREAIQALRALGRAVRTCEPELAALTGIDLV
jgi:hypothetical protein